MRRYKAINFEYDDDNGTGTALDIIEDLDSEFVRYEDISLLLQRLADLEQLAYDFAMGKTDGEDIVKYVHDAINS